MAFWGRNKCKFIDRVLEPNHFDCLPKIHATREHIECVNPDVVI